MFAQENIPIEELVRQVQLLTEDARKKGLQLQHHSLPVVGIIRSPCIAIRYHMEDSKVIYLQSERFSRSELTLN